MKLLRRQDDAEYVQYAHHFIAQPASEYRAVVRHYDNDLHWAATSTEYTRLVLAVYEGTPLLPSQLSGNYLRFYTGINTGF